MAWNFRGSLARIELQRDSRVLLPFLGCAWLSDSFGDAGAQPVLDARLELVRHDDIMIEAIREEAASVAQRCGTVAPNSTGCIYRLDSTINLLVGVSAETMDMVKRDLLAALAEKRLNLNATIEFPGFAPEDPVARLASSRPYGITRKTFESGRSPIHFEDCSLSFVANDWAPRPAGEQLPYLSLVAGDEQPRL